MHVPNTAGRGYEYFKRYFYPQSHKQAIIVDERIDELSELQAASPAEAAEWERRAHRTLEHLSLHMNEEDFKKHIARTTFDSLLKDFPNQTIDALCSSLDQHPDMRAKLQSCLST